MPARQQQGGACRTPDLALALVRRDQHQRTVVHSGEANFPQGVETQAVFGEKAQAKRGRSASPPASATHGGAAAGAAEPSQGHADARPRQMPRKSTGASERHLRDSAAEPAQVDAAPDEPLDDAIIGVVRDQAAAAARAAAAVAAEAEPGT